MSTASTITVSLATKVNLGNYEHVEARVETSFSVEDGVGTGDAIGRAQETLAGYIARDRLIAFVSGSAAPAVSADIKTTLPAAEEPKAEKPKRGRGRAAEEARPAEPAVDPLADEPAATPAAAPANHRATRDEITKLCAENPSAAERVRKLLSSRGLEKLRQAPDDASLLDYLTAAKGETPAPAASDDDVI